MNSKRVLLNLGCGPDAIPTEWTDIDGSLNLFWQRRLPGFFMQAFQRMKGLFHWPKHVRYHDLRQPLPYQESTVDAVYASHVLEHLCLSDAKTLLVDISRVLKPGGILRLVLPDLESMVRDYIASEDAEAALRLNQRLLFRPLDQPTGFFHRLQANLNDMHSHKFMYDAAYLMQLLEASGFSEIRKMGYLESRIVEVDQVEQAGRILEGEGFVVEAVKGRVGV